MRVLPNQNWFQPRLDSIDNSEICRFDNESAIKNPYTGKRHIAKFLIHNTKEDEKLKKKFPLELDLYKQHPLYYFINEQGFRSKENYENLNNCQVDIILGCSFTFGIGLHEEITWPFILRELEASSHNSIVNLAVPGTGTDTAFRLFLTHLNKYKQIRRVIHFQPYYNRHELIHNGIAQTSLGHAGIKNDTFKKHFTDHHLKTEFIDEVNTGIKHIKNISAIKALCDMNNIPYYFLAGADVLTNPKIKEEIFARDIHHGGFTGQFTIAKQFFNKIKNKDTNIQFQIRDDFSFDRTDKPHVPPKLDIKAFRYYAKNNPSISKFYPNAFYSNHKIT